MVNRTKASQLPLNQDWEDDVPQEVQNAADDYVMCLRKKCSAAEKFNGAKTALIELMK